MWEIARHGNRAAEGEGQSLLDTLKYEMLRHSVLHADETLLRCWRRARRRRTVPASGRTARACSKTSSPVVYDFAPSRVKELGRAFLQQDNQPRRGKLVCDDFSGYMASFAQGVTEVGCAAHARRKFFDFHVNTGSAVAEQALRYFGELYEIEHDVRTLDTSRRLRLRQERSRPLADSMHAWMLAQRLRATKGTGLARALDYSLKRWSALTR